MRAKLKVVRTVNATDNSRSEMSRCSDQ